MQVQSTDVPKDFQGHGFNQLRKKSMSRAKMSSHIQVHCRVSLLERLLSLNESNSNVRLKCLNISRTQVVCALLVLDYVKFKCRSQSSGGVTQQSVQQMLLLDQVKSEHRSLSCREVTQQNVWRMLLLDQVKFEHRSQSSGEVTQQSIWQMLVPDHRR